MCLLGKDKYQKQKGHYVTYWKHLEDLLNEQGGKGFTKHYPVEHRYLWF